MEQVFKANYPDYIDWLAGPRQHYAESTRTRPVLPSATRMMADYHDPARAARSGGQLAGPPPSMITSPRPRPVGTQGNSSTIILWCAKTPRQVTTKPVTWTCKNSPFAEHVSPARPCASSEPGDVRHRKRPCLANTESARHGLTLPVPPELLLRFKGGISE